MVDDKNKNLLDHEGWFNYEDFYNHISLNQGFEVFVELGVWSGRSISHLASRLTDKEIYAVDLFNQTHKYIDTDLQEVSENIYTIYNNYLNKQNTAHKIKDIIGNSWESASLFKDNSVDFLFIDADHRYECVKKDIINWLPKMKKNGIISGHDYDEQTTEDNGVATAVKELIPDFKTFAPNVWYKKI